MEKYRANGLAIFQVLFDGLKQGERPDQRPFLGKLDQQPSIRPAAASVPLNPQGACGIDPDRE